MDNKLLIVETTVTSLEIGEIITHELVGRRLVACGQISSPIKSVYIWQGEVCSEAEYRITYKTVPEKFGAIKQTIKELHPYEVPEIVSFLAEGSSEYQLWVKEVCDGR